MKRIFRLISILSIMFLFNRVVFAESGSLKINVDISTQNSIKEQTYFEQDSALQQMFDSSLSQMITQQKTEESVSNKKDTALLFLPKESQKINPINTEQLFLSTTPTQGRNITLRTEEVSVDILSICLIFLGLVFCGVSIYQMIRKRKENHE